MIASRRTRCTCSSVDERSIAGRFHTSAMTFSSCQIDLQTDIWENRRVPDPGQTARGGENEFKDRRRHRSRGCRRSPREELLRRAAVGGGAISSAAASRAPPTVRPAHSKRQGPSAAGRSASACRADRRRTSSTGRTSSPAGPGALVVRAGRRCVTFDSQFKLTFDGLAETIEANKKADVWTIRVHDGIEFHNGKTLGADDVIYSLQRLINPKLGLFGGAALVVDRPDADQEAGQAHGPLHAEAAGRRPSSTRSASTSPGIVPVGYSPTAVGEGEAERRHRPVQAAELHPGPAERARPQPELLADGPALLRQGHDHRLPRRHGAGQRAVSAARWTRSPTCRPRRSPSSTGTRGRRCSSRRARGWTPICMRVDTAPFNDVRVRQAMRLIADRPQMVAAGALRPRPRRERPLRAVRRASTRARCRSGTRTSRRRSRSSRRPASEDLTSTCDDERRARHERGGAGLRAAGEGRRRHRQRQDPRQRRLLRRLPEVDVLDRLLGLAQLPAPGRRRGPADLAVQRDALARPRTTRSSSRCTTRRWADGRPQEARAIVHEMQKLEYDYGGYIVWGFSTLLDGYATKVKG